MTNYVFSFLISLILSFFIGLFLKKFAYSRGIMVEGKKGRIYQRPVVQLSGIAISIAFFTGLFICYFLCDITPAEMFGSYKAFLGYIIGAFVLFVVGVLNDIKPLPNKVKVIFYLLAALCAVTSGNVILAFNFPFISDSVKFYPLFGYSVTVGWILIMIFVFKILNNMEQYASGILNYIFLILLFISFMLGSVPLQLLSLLLLGSHLGYIPFNVGRNFTLVGETSLIISGYTLSVLSILWEFKQAVLIWVALPLIILGYPILEIVVYLVRKLLKSKENHPPIMGRMHYRMYKRDAENKNFLLALFFIMITTGLTAFVQLDKGNLASLLFIIPVTVVMIFAYLIFEKFEFNNNSAEMFEKIRKNK